MKKIIALLTATLFVLNPVAVLAEETEKNETESLAETSVSTPVSPVEDVYAATYTLSEGLTYRRQISYSPTYGQEREFVLSYTPNESTRLAFANGEYLYQTGTIRNLAAAEYPDENYIAGINADFFNMSTGVPESAYIKNKELYTTDRDSFCLAERENGSFFIDKPQIKLTLTAYNSGTEYNVLHLNKEFSQYGLYLYNARYSPTTHITAANTSVVLYPYSDKKTEQELIKTVLYPEKQTEPEENAPVIAEQNEQTADSDEETTTDTNAETELEKEPDAETEMQSETSSETESEQLTDTVLAEMLERRDNLEPYSEEALKLQDEIEKYLSEQTGYRKIGSSYFRLSPAAPQIGKSEDLVVDTVNPTAGNESIPKDAYLLAADNTSYGYILMSFVPGQTFSLSASGNEAFYDVKNAVGTGTVIVKESQPVDDRTFSHYLSPQPRSAVGIRADGSLVLFAVDGRQSGYSAGFKLYDLAKRMVSLGCVYAANLDGGGSTAVNASLRGNDSATTVNSPSGKAERRVSNGIVFTNTLEKTGTPAEAYFYGDYYLTLSDTPISLGNVVLSDKNGYAVSISDSEEQPTPSFYTKDNTTIVSDGNLDPAGTIGAIEVFASLDGRQSENVAATVVSLAAPDEIVLSADKTEIAPFETASLSVAAFYRKLHVASGLHSYTWSVSETQIKADSEVTSPDIPENAEKITPAGTVADGIFTPSTEGTTVTVTASRGDVSANIQIKIDAYPFVDMKDHWAVKEIYKLYKTGVVKGEIAEDGTAYYLPERQFSRYEFCVMLERLTGIGSELPVPELPAAAEETAAAETESAETAAGAETDTEVSVSDQREPQADSQTLEELLGLADASLIPDWAFSAVYRLSASGLLEGILHHDESWNEIFDGDKPITRAEVIHVIGKICEAAPLDFSLEEFTDLDEWQKRDDYIKNAVNAGIFSGYEDMSLRLSGLLTRAEGAAVFIRLSSHLDESDDMN